MIELENEILVGGVWRKGRGNLITSINPATNDLNIEFHAASTEDVIEAVEAGHAAMNMPEWRFMKPHLRAKILRNIGNGIKTRGEELAQLQTADTGKCLSETRALVASACGTFHYMASALEVLESEITPSRGDYMTMSVHEPIGVVGAITPWNSPIASDAQKVAPALAAGNAVILKPAEWTSLVSLLFGRICSEAGLPPGLLSVLPGKGSVIGDAVIRHPLVKKVSFTGGTNTGRHLAKISGEKLMPISLELGGKSPTIIFEDSDFDHAINGVMYGVFSSTGQSCIAGSRVFIQKSIFKDFVEELVERTNALNVGSPLDMRTQVAPMVHANHRDSVSQYVELAKTEGGQILCGGHIPEEKVLQNGAFYLPTIISGLDNTAKICREEIFGPVAVVLPFENEEDLVAMSNDNEYGLAAGIWTRDFQKAYRLARRLEAGTVWINTYKQFSVSTPFGGVKDSGLGREKGRKGILEYMNQKSLYWGLNEDPIAWGDER